MKLSSIQFLRMIAALLVAWLHAIATQVQHGPPLSQISLRGMDLLNIGVDIFFIISGFIIAFSASRYKGWYEAGIFLQRRFIRINPVYYIASLAFLAVNVHHMWKIHYDFSAAMILKSILLLPVADHTTWIDCTLTVVAWTLSFEWLFYILFSLAVAARTRYKTGFLAVTIAVLVSGHFIFHPADIRLLFITNPILFEFLLGVVIYQCYRRWTPSRVIAFSLLGAGLIICGFCFFNSALLLGDKDLTIDGSIAFQRLLYRGIPAALILSGCIFLEKKGAGRLLWTNRLVTRLGDASYSIYLTHYTTYTLLEAITVRVGSIYPSSLSIAIWFIAAIVNGVLFYRIVEQPLLRKLTSPQNKTLFAKH